MFFTRFITNFCAPEFVFLAGTSAFLYGSKKTKPELFKFLFTRGIWLILLELIVNNFIWTFDITYSFPVFQVIWAIGFSMVCLSFLIYLPKRIIIIIGIILVAGHNLLDGIVMQGSSFKAIVWYILHQDKFLVLGPNKMILFHYPLIPWIGLMALGYCFGILYSKGFDAARRKKWLLGLGFGSIALFFILRGINEYGDLVPWTIQKDSMYTVLSFFNTTKYPPSLMFLLMTIGPSLIFLYFIENVKNKVTDFFVVFGRVPLFFYFLHVLVIHIVAIMGILIFGGNWRDMGSGQENRRRRPTWRRRPALAKDGRSRPHRPSRIVARLPPPAAADERKTLATAGGFLSGEQLRHLRLVLEMSSRYSGFIKQQRDSFPGIAILLRWTPFVRTGRGSCIREARVRTRGRDSLRVMG